MKKLISLIISLISLSSYGEEVITKSFPSIEACQSYTAELIERYQEKPIKELFKDVGIHFEENSETGIMVSFADKQKESAGETKYIEKIGTIALGDFIQKVGYIVKYENFCIFYEITIGKKDIENYSIINLTYSFDDDTHRLIEDIPEYYWK